MAMKDILKAASLVALSALFMYAVLILHDKLYGQESSSVVPVDPEVRIYAVTEATGVSTRYALESAPESARVYYETGRSYLKKKLYSAALVRFDKAIEVDTGFAEVYYLRARAYMKLNKPQKALADLNRTIGLRPEDNRLMGGCLYSRGVLLMDMGEFQASADDFTKALELLPEYAIIYIKRSASHKELKQYGKAIRDLKTVFKINPALAPLYEQELKELERALGRQPSE